MARPGRLDLVTYDLDGTLIDGTAFLLLARRFGFEDAVLEEDRRFRAGEITLEECFRREFAMMEGRAVEEVHAALAEGTWFKGIEAAVERLHEAGLRVAVVTDNPDFVVTHVERFGITDRVCSEGEIRDGKITGRVTPRFDKWAGLSAFLAREGIDPKRVAHVGNDVNDLKVWPHVGLAVCVEPTGPEVAKGAHVVWGMIEDHGPIAERIIAWHRGEVDFDKD